MSPDGRYIAFVSAATNLVPDDTNGVEDVFVHDRDADGNGVYDETGPGQRATFRVSVASTGAQGNGASGNCFDIPVCAPLDLSPDGFWVAFTSYATNLVPGDTITVTFPVPESTSTYTAAAQTVQAQFTEAAALTPSPTATEAATATLAVPTIDTSLPTLPGPGSATQAATAAGAAPIVTLTPLGAVVPTAAAPSRVTAQWVKNDPADGTIHAAGDPKAKRHAAAIEDEGYNLSWVK